MDPTKVSGRGSKQTRHQQGRAPLTLKCITNKVENDLLHQVWVDEQDTFLTMIEMNGELEGAVRIKDLDFTSP